MQERGRKLNADDRERRGATAHARASCPTHGLELLTVDCQDDCGLTTCVQVGVLGQAGIGACLSS